MNTTRSPTVTTCGVDLFDLLFGLIMEISVSRRVDRGMGGVEKISTRQHSHQVVCNHKYFSYCSLIHNPRITCSCSPHFACLPRLLNIIFSLPYLTPLYVLSSTIPNTLHHFLRRSQTNLFLLQHSIFSIHKPT